MRPWAILFGIVASAILLVGCAGPTEESLIISSALSKMNGPPTVEQLLSMEYTITDPVVRRVLTKARKNFFVQVRSGHFTYPASALVDPYENVEVDATRAVIGDVTGDGKLDAVVRVSIGEGESSVTELAVVSVQSGALKHVASFPLGHVDVHSVKIANGKIRVNVIQMVPGDPGPRNSELTLSL